MSDEKRGGGRDSGAGGGPSDSTTFREGSLVSKLPGQPIHTTLFNTDQPGAASGPKGDTGGSGGSGGSGGAGGSGSSEGGS